ncbi:MAG: hypothetical protein AAF696_22055 [Bacteroidota bacterium]
MTIEARKYHLIAEIMQVSDEKILKRFEEILTEYHQQMNDLRGLVKPIRSKKDINQLIQEQGFTGVDREKMNRLIDEIDIEESIEELLAML